VSNNNNTAGFSVDNNALGSIAGGGSTMIAVGLNKKF
jgi:hypothetical protein